MRRRRPLTTVLVAAVAASAGLAGCTDGPAGAPSARGHDGVAPLAVPAAPDDSAGSSSSGPESGHVEVDERAVEQPTGERPIDAPADAIAEQRSRVSEVLDRYGVVLTELAADPSIDLARFATRWSTVADPSSPFSQDMLHILVARVRVDQMIIRPGPDGRSYVHRPVRITTVDDDTIDFTWCGYSPGIGVHVVTGEVLDDAVGHASGTGRLVRAEGRWLLDTLDQDQLVALPAGSGDPCASGGDR
ncbi:MAG: hypothetical protein ACK4V6_04235 [Microthrixaceae bacterium]